MFVLFFKQKTAYEMRISDWSSDVCSSDLALYFGMREGGLEGAVRAQLEPLLTGAVTDTSGTMPPEWSAFVETFAGLFPALAATFWALLIAVNGALAQGLQIGRASCRERVCQYG